MIADTETKLKPNEFIIAINNRFHDICDLYEIYPAATFKAFVNEEELQYAYFITNVSTRDRRILYMVQGCLIQLFEADTKDIRKFRRALREQFSNSRTFTSSSTLISETPEQRIDVHYLIEAACHKISKGSNGAGKVKGFLSAINLQVLESGPWIDVVQRPMNATNVIQHQQEDAAAIKATKSFDELLYTIDTGNQFVRIHLAINSYDFEQMIKGTKIQRSEQSVMSRDDPSWDERNFESLIAENDGCRFMQELNIGSRRLSMKELNGLAKAICNVSGVQTKIKEWMCKSNQYDLVQIDFISRLMSRYRRIGYAIYPPTCRSFCNQRSACTMSKDIAFHCVTDLLQQKQNTVFPLRERQRNTVCLEHVRQDMNSKFEVDLASKGNKIHVYKCFVGVGKTYMYLAKLRNFIEEGKTVIIALPTHLLREDVVGELNKHLTQEQIDEAIIDVKNIPFISLAFQEELQNYLNVGNSAEARAFIRNYQKEMQESGPDDPENHENELDEFMRIIELLQRKEDTTGKIIFTTHERLFSLGHINPDLVIIDEDISVSMMKQQRVYKDELNTLRSILPGLRGQYDGNDSSGFDLVEERLNCILSSRRDQLNSFSQGISGQRNLRRFLLRQITNHRGSFFNSRIIDLVFSKAEFVFHQTEEANGRVVDTVSFVIRRELPFNCKAFIMSATVDEEILRQLNGEKEIGFETFPLPMLRASVTMRHDYSFSRNWFKRKTQELGEFTGYLALIRDYALPPEHEHEPEHANHPLIVTFKSYEREFHERGFNLTLHFGNTMGLNEYEGKNVAVFGTPNINPVAYSLYHNVIFTGRRLLSIPGFEKRLVKNSGYRFYFKTAEEGQFQKIHMWMVESEIIQALGRARPINNKCLIRIYSNYPPGDLDITFLNNSSR